MVLVCANAARTESSHRLLPVKKFSKGHHSSLNELNITPLLDLAFVLLVIFIITTPQLSNDLEMNLPSPRRRKFPFTAAQGQSHHGGRRRPHFAQ